MASFDVKSLFTNVPVKETRDIIVNQLFPAPDYILHSLNKTQFAKLLNLATNDTIFLFDNQLYKQTDGMAMGSPLGPAFANSFLSFHEQNWLNACPPEFKPTVYKRYVDDCFLIFNHQSQATLFLDYLNTKHRNITFTMEGQDDNSLPFLDILVKHSNGSFSTSLYRKPSTTLLGLNFFSFLPTKYKLSALQCRLYRAFKLCSTWIDFHEEIKYLHNFSNFNLFPISLISDLVRKLLDDVYRPKSPLITVPKQKIYLKIPYIGLNTIKMINSLNPTLHKTFPAVQFIFTPVNGFKISNFFKLKDTIPLGLRSSLVYQFTCADCNARYIGQTGLQLNLRISKHLGLSYRTNLPLTTPESSSIRTHSLDMKHSVSREKFEILASANDSLSRRILESLYIRELKPELNKDLSSIPLFLF